MPQFTKTDLAKYPFLKETAEYVKKLDIKIEDLTTPELTNILTRAEEKLQEAILYALVTRKPHNEEIEILSFPTATMLTVATNNPFIKKRYALAEAKQAYSDLQLEPKQKLITIAQTFGWQLTPNQNPKIPYPYALAFTDYLRNTTHLREAKWKLVNRNLTNGKVYLTANEAARLLSEEIRRHIEMKLETKNPPNLPPRILEAAQKLNKLTMEKIGKSEIEGLPETMVQEAFPPCINALYQAFSTGHHLSHVGRFALTTFLVNVGMPPEKVTELFKSFSDYNERMTRYQVEHIAGERGSRTKYIPPKCETLQTHGICTNPDILCRNVRHPLSYYRKKAKTTK
jgi:DNA primase large subunit